MNWTVNDDSEKKSKTQKNVLAISMRRSGAIIIFEICSLQQRECKSSRIYGAI